MKKVKLRFITIICFAVLFAVTLGLAFFFGTPQTAYAASEYETTAIFSQGTGGTVAAYQKTGEDKAYTAFDFSDGGKVYYRRNLALKWFEEKGKESYFNLQFRFENVTFETFTITFESAEENVTKEGKTENSVIFTQSGGSVTVAVKNSAGETGATTPVDATQWLTLSLADGGNQVGEFGVNLLQGDSVETTSIGSFTNVGGNYLEYRSSAASTPQTPITFTVKLPALAEGETAKNQKVLLRSLNGQTLEATGGTAEETDGDNDGLLKVTGGKVEDNKAPAVVLNETVYAFKIGQKFSTSSINYRVIDVCDNNASARLYYYMLKKKDDAFVKGEDGDYREVRSSSPTYFMPTAEMQKDENIYVSVRFDFGKSSGASEETNYVYLDWYADDSAVEEKGEGDEAFDYIIVNREKKGPSFVGLEADDKKSENAINHDVYDSAVANYQKAVEEAAEKANAGSGAYIYLPSMRGLISGGNSDYRNLKFSVYYHKPSHTETSSASSAISLSYNTLKFEINEQGYYTFRVFAADASGNGMHYYDADGNLVTLSSSNVWDIENIPEFRFYVSNKGVTIENPEEQTLGYRDSSYSVSSFEVIALDGIEKDYTLYYFDESKLENGDKAPTYSDFVKNANEAGYIQDFLDKKYLKEISKYDAEVSEDDDEWDKTDNDYAWYKNNSLSFTPQLSGYYVVELTVTDPNRSNEVKTSYQVIEVQNPFDYTPGQSEWLKDNVVSIVLFAISAVLLVIVVALIVVKPSDKKVEDVDVKKLKGQKKDK